MYRGEPPGSTRHPAIMGLPPLSRRYSERRRLTAAHTSEVIVTFITEVTFEQASALERPCSRAHSMAWGASVVAISNHHRALGPSWPGPVRQADVALSQGATTFQEQLQGSESGSYIRVPAGPKSRLRAPHSLFGQMPFLPSRVCSACAENPFGTDNTSLHQASGSKPCLRAPGRIRVTLHHLTAVTTATPRAPHNQVVR
ncbi:hypothetical protein Taro_032221 [Colocasia esculenta]|uniref:Uncharacterized protein n=1 Tax=Colocasia esculenta TaxID=4460 RepID=A0A843VS45_COLES|nr:hypothetical protein [Colocasia esculenta]